LINEGVNDFVRISASVEVPSISMKFEDLAEVRNELHARPIEA
jgi:hypothetical protein